MDNLLDGKVAIVTGSGAGIGEAIARAFAAEGARLVISDIDADRAHHVAESLPDALAVQCDVSDETQVMSMVDQAMEHYGAVHVMVPNAGVTGISALTEMSYAEWRRVTSVNLDGVFLSIRYAAPAIIASGGGTIVTISSITSTGGSALIAHYAASKAAVRNLTETASVELGPLGVRINALLPGYLGTALVHDAVPGFEQAGQMVEGTLVPFLESKQGGRLGTVEEVATAAVFFASDQSSFCNGSSLVLDGGLVASLL
ncbi:SDR family oxidoreductase [soil metagenome]